MKILKRSMTIALLLFVGATVGLLIAQEVSHASAPHEDARTANAPEATAPAAGLGSLGPAAASGTEPASVATASASPPHAENTESDASSEVIEETDAEPVCVVDAIYFHNTLRCRTCKTIEETAKAVIEEAFAQELSSGRMRWSAVNMERQQHVVEEYDLVQPTLTLVRSTGAEQSDWVSLDETWSLIRFESRFANYVTSEVRAFLEACP